MWQKETGLVLLSQQLENYLYLIYHKILFKSHWEGISMESHNVIFKFPFSENILTFKYVFLHFIGST